MVVASMRLPGWGRMGLSQFLGMRLRAMLSSLRKMGTLSVALLCAHALSRSPARVSFVCLREHACLLVEQRAHAGERGRLLERPAGGVQRGEVGLGERGLHDGAPEEHGPRPLGGVGESAPLGRLADAARALVAPAVGAAQQQHVVGTDLVARRREVLDVQSARVSCWSR